MTKEEFWLELGKFKWRFCIHPLIRKIRTKTDCYCPLVFLANQKLNKYYLNCQYTEAGRALGLSSEFVRKVAAAADYMRGTYSKKLKTVLGLTHG